MRRLAELPATAELVVIGAGVIGAATAFAAGGRLLVERIAGRCNVFALDRTFKTPEHKTR
jgi:hypothetical protein